MFLHWPQRFRNAFRGIAVAFGRDWTLMEHLLAAAIAVALAAILRVSLAEWCLVFLCLGSVLGAEFFNTALEELAPAIDRKQNEQLGRALDVAAAGVFVMALAAAAVGACIFFFRLGVLAGWWIAA
jgi:diacylglycerol kinase (ATP)